MNHKYLISGGCSFSEASESWGSSLVSNKNLFNTAKGGCGNEFIRRQVIFKVSELKLFHLKF